MVQTSTSEGEKAMRRSIVGRLATLGAVASLMAVSAASFARSSNEVPAGPAFEQVDSILLMTRPHSWQVIDDDTVIVWATAFDPYLVELAFKSYDLKFAEVIGITQVGSRVYAKFDAVKVRGFRYPIDSIYKVTREEARNLVRGS
jgi:hypothetical protein